MCLVYAAGVALVPAGVLGRVACVARSRTRAELAFGALASAIVAALLLQASLWGDASLMQERYTFYAVPLLALAATLYLTRGATWPRVHALLCAGLVILAATVPLSGYVVAFGNRHSAVLFGVSRLEQWLGVAAGSLAFAAAAGAVAILALAAARTRYAIAGVTLLALAFLVGTSVAAASYDISKNDAIRTSYLPRDPSWVDHAGVGDVALVYARGHYKDGLEQLFWNRSVDRVLLLPGADALDTVAATGTRIADDGTLLAAGEAVRSPVLVDNRAASITLASARVLASSPAYQLWQPAGSVRLASYSAGWYRDGWLASSGSFQVWRPAIAGRLRFRVRGAAGPGATTLTITSPAGRRTIPVPAGATRTIELPTCGRRSWEATFTADHLVFLADRVVTLRSTRPVWTPDPRACGR